MEGGGNVLIHRLECLEDKGVIGGCRGDAMGECYASVTDGQGKRAKSPSK